MKYLTALQLGILSAERTALIAFVDGRALGRTVAVNGHAHYYDQSYVNDDVGLAAVNECQTAGCVAGFVFAHARHVQRLRRLRGMTNPEDYIDAATKIMCDDDGRVQGNVCQLLCKLYSESSSRRRLVEARKVVSKALRTGKVTWP